MSDYKHVLVGLDLTPEEAPTVFNKAKTLAEMYGAKLSVAHVIEPLVFAYAGEVPIDFTNTQQIMETRAKEQLIAFANKHGVAEQNTSVLLGPTAAELKEYAIKHEVDLIIVGSHGRHGLALLLGSTASDVIHGAQCDVLAVRV